MFVRCIIELHNNAIWSCKSTSREHAKREKHREKRENRTEDLSQLDSSVILIPLVGNGAPNHIHLSSGMPSISVPTLPYTPSGTITDNLVMKLGPTSLMSCNEATLECWSLKLGNDAWARSADMLFAHPYTQCHMDFGSTKMLFGGGDL